jgi:NADH:ubiquinone oxidoreductase subunit F (NADH-binding)
VEEVRAAGLRGRGGAAFPTGAKLQAVAERSARRGAIVLVNATEGEPASNKDKILISLAPHLVLDGAVWGAAAVGAQRIIVAVERGGSRRDTLLRALGERRGERSGVPIEVIETPTRFVAGEESALVHVANGGPALPTAVPPRPFERGVEGLPTLVSNAETFAHIAQIAVHGAPWFRRLGTAAEPGTALVTISGGVASPGVLEAPTGTPLASLLSAAGAPDRIGAVLVGGYFGAWLTSDEAAVARLSVEDLRPFGASPGCGVVVVLPDGACGVRESARVLRWMAGESAGQCGPCVHGLAAIATGFQALAERRTPAHAVPQLARWAGLVEGRGGCKLPDGAVRFLRSALRCFADEITRHQAFGTCVGPHHASVLPMPKVRVR